MFAPSAELAKKYAEETVSANDPQDRRIQELIHDYILRNLAPDPKTGRRRRVMMLLFQGEDAVRRTRSVVGNFGSGPPRRRNHPRHLRRPDPRRERPVTLLRAGGAGRADAPMKPNRSSSSGRSTRIRDGGVLENVIRLPARREAAAHAGADQAGELPLPHRPAGQHDRLLLPHRPVHRRRSKSIA